MLTFLFYYWLIGAVIVALLSAIVVAVHGERVQLQITKMLLATITWPIMIAVVLYKLAKA